MESEMNFCPFCDAPQQKLLFIDDALIFCKECNKFFLLKEKEFRCPKCEKTKISDSDFPSPGGETILQCKSCKKMFSVNEFLEKSQVLVLFTGRPVAWSCKGRLLITEQ